MMTQERTTLRDKQAIRNEYEMRVAEGEAREQLLDNLADRHQKSTRQIERYIHDARQADEERLLSLAQRLRARVDRRHTVHERALRQMAQRLENQVALPPASHVFTVSRDNEYWYPDQISWKLSEAGRIQLFLRLEHDDDTRMVYRSLMEHLSAPGFTELPAMIAQWKKRAADYLAECYGLVSEVTAAVEAVLGIAVAPAYAVRPGVFPSFPLSICYDAVERASGPTATSQLRYATERPGEALFQLRFGADAVAIATSDDELDRLQREHIDLRERYAASPRAQAVAAVALEAGDLEARIRDDLRRFRLSTPLPGHCMLCAPPIS